MVNGRDPAKAEQTLAALEPVTASTSSPATSNSARRARRSSTARSTTSAGSTSSSPTPAEDRHAPIVDLTDEAMQDSLVWNFWHTFWTMRRAFHYMIPQQSGRVMSVSSLEGKVGKPGISIYVIAKHAINGLTKSAAHEVGTLGITVNALCPARSRPTS